MKLRNKWTWLAVIVLIGIEQAIKLVINHSFLDARFPILPPLLYFSPVFNRRYSWFNSMLQFDGSKWIHILFVAAFGILILLFYSFVNKKLGSYKIIHALFAVLFSGAACSLIDKVFWDGSLDYIYLKGFFTFDLKDVYINVFIGLLILAMLLKSEALRMIDEKNILNDFARYIFRKNGPNR